MTVSIRKMGSSQGVLIPKLILAQVGPGELAGLTVNAGKICIVDTPRQAKCLGAPYLRRPWKRRCVPCRPYSNPSIPHASTEDSHARELHYTHP